jgi:hypothetical protein
MMPPPVPRIGEIVHYYENEGEQLTGPCAAIITSIHPKDQYRVDLAIFPSGLFGIRSGACLSETPMHRCWRRPDGS